MSTVLDATVCLLLVSAAALTLSLGSGGVPGTPDADEPADVLSTSTAAVPHENGTAHDALAGHLATATVLGSTVDGQRLDRSEYPQAVSATVGNSTGERVSVVATWQPFPDASLEGRVRLGTAPPPDASVGTATMTVSSGLDEVSLQPSSDDARSYEDVATAVAAELVRWLFPPETTRAALVDRRRADATTARYDHTAATLGVDVGGELHEANATGANRRLAEALAVHVAADLREAYPTPAAAAADARPERVEIVVRRWEP